MSKHTPGPWFCGQDGFNLGNGVVYSRHSNGNPKDICHLHGWGGEMQANAKLIAAAPDLLEALEEFIAHGEQAFGCDFDVVVKAKLVIAKSRGES